MFGREARVPLDLMIGPPPDYCASQSETTYIREVRDRLESAFDLVRVRLDGAHRCQKKLYDQRSPSAPSFSVGTSTNVWLYSPVVQVGQTSKFSKPWTGPYRILRRIGEVNYRITPVYPTLDNSRC